MKECTHHQKITPLIKKRKEPEDANEIKELLLSQNADSVKLGWFFMEQKNYRFHGLICRFKGNSYFVEHFSTEYRQDNFNIAYTFTLRFDGYKEEFMDDAIGEVDFLDLWHRREYLNVNNYYECVVLLGSSINPRKQTTCLNFVVRV